MKNEFVLKILNGFDGKYYQLWLQNQIDLLKDSTVCDVAYHEFLKLCETVSTDS